jgi:hypothetical protein
LVKAATGGRQPTWEDYIPHVRPLPITGADGVALRRSTRKAAEVGNLKRVYRNNAFNAVAENFYY